MLDMINETDWKFLKMIKDAAIYTRNSPRGIIQVKGVVDFPFTPDEVISQVIIVEERKHYDEQFDEGRILSEHCEHTYIAYGKLKKIMVIQPRDLVFTIQFIKSINTGIIYTPTYSILHDDFPAKEAPVRAVITLGGWALVPTKTGCSTVYVAEVDPKGNIPKFMIKMSADL
jgi:hypothetical protein